MKIKIKEFFSSQKQPKTTGRHEEAVEIAIRLKKKGMPIEDIQEITKLSAGEIEALGI